MAETKSVTEAPTNQGTLDTLLPKIPEDLLDFVTVCDQHWNTTGYMLTEQRALVDWGYERSDYQRCISNVFVIAALKERGIDVPRELFKANAEPESPEALKAKRLSPLQLVVANKLCDLTDQRSDKKKLQDCGVDTTTYQRWLRDRNFSDYLNTITESLLGNSQHEASLALLDKVKAGDLGAIKLHLEYTGRIEKEVKAGPVGSGGEVKDLNLLLTRILEIVVDECDGPTATKVANRMLEATKIHAVAMDMSANIIQPEVAEMRVLNPQMQALMDSTSGGDV